VVGGIFINSIKKPSMVARAIALITNHPFGVGGSPFRTRERAGYVDSVAFGTFRRSVFERVGLFDERLVRNQDTEMWARIRTNGGKVYCDPTIKVYYYNQTTISGFIRQAFWTGLWCPITLRLSRRAMQLRHIAPFCFILYLLSLACLFLIGMCLDISALEWLSFCGSLIYAVPWLFSALQMTAGTTTMRGGVAIFPLALLLLLIYHSTYGIGSWWGLFTVFTGKFKRYLGASMAYSPPILPSEYSVKGDLKCHCTPAAVMKG
jgi:hypothetical protein